MEENVHKFEIKIDPIDCHEGLREQMTNFDSIVKNEVLSGVRLAEKIEKKLASRFCHCCFFGKVAGRVMGEPLCEECARELYGITGIHGEYDKEKWKTFTINCGIVNRRHCRYSRHISRPRCVTGNPN